MVFKANIIASKTILNCGLSRIAWGTFHSVGSFPQSKKLAETVAKFKKATFHQRRLS